MKVIHFEISRRGTNVFSEFDTVLRLLKIYRKERPDIVHHVAMKPMLYGSPVSLTRVTYTVNWIAGMGWLFLSKTRRAKILQFVVKKALGLLPLGTKVIVENDDDKGVISGIGLAKTRRAVLSVQLRHFLRQRYWYWALLAAAAYIVKTDGDLFRALRAGNSRSKPLRVDDADGSKSDESLEVLATELKTT